MFTFPMHRNVDAAASPLPAEGTAEGLAHLPLEVLAPFVERLGSPPAVDLAPDPEEQILFRERQHRLRAAFKALPEDDQLCLRLSADGLRYRDIAATVGIPIGSVAISLASPFKRLERSDSR